MLARVVQVQPVTEHALAGPTHRIGHAQTRAGAGPHQCLAGTGHRYLGHRHFTTVRSGGATMLTQIQRRAIVHCLTGIDRHAHRHYPWPGPQLLAALRETPVVGHPNPTARHVGVVPVPAPPGGWPCADDPVQTLRAVAADLLRSTNQAAIEQANKADVRALAWAFMHAIDVDDRHTARVVEAVDIDDTVYVVTHLPHQADGQIEIREVASDASIPETITVLRALVHGFRIR